MDEITLNGFEVFEDFLPGANVPKKETQPAGNDENKDILDSVGESMTDEELEALRNPKKEEDTKDDKQEEEVKEPVKEPKKESKKEDKKSESEEEIEEEVVEEPTNEPDSNAVSAFLV